MVSSATVSIDLTLTASPSTPEPPRSITGKLIGRVIERGTRRPLAETQIDIAGQTAFADDGGRFAIDDLPSGTHRLAASVFEHETAELEVTIRPGETENVQLILLRTR